MNNIVPIGLPKRPGLAVRQALLLENFALNRRTSGDVYWLKENAEILNILRNSGAGLLPDALEVYAPFYDTLEDRLRFFPQYYRFLLSICLDLEDLGMKGDTGARLCQRVAGSDYAAAELSDLQRAETRHLLARRGQTGSDPRLTARLHTFINTPQTFSLPNKKAAYELTHIVFYLSDYGRVVPDLAPEAMRSLEFAGLLAWLDQDVDLLAEVCIAIRFAGGTPGEIWEDWLACESAGFVLMPDSPDGGPDAYHEYLVTSWWAAQTGAASFPGVSDRRGLSICRVAAGRGPLRSISEYMFRLGDARSSDWHQMRGLLQTVLAEDEHRILEGAAASSDVFDDFFQGFARAGN